jgi:hypothetical protein
MPSHRCFTVVEFFDVLEPPMSRGSSPFPLVVIVGFNVYTSYRLRVVLAVFQFFLVRISNTVAFSHTINPNIFRCMDGRRSRERGGNCRLGSSAPLTVKELPNFNFFCNSVPRPKSGARLILVCDLFDLVPDPCRSVR